MNDYYTNKRKRQLRTDEEWDKVSKFHKWHRKVLGMPFNSDVVKFYITIAIASAVFTLLFR